MSRPRRRLVAIALIVGSFAAGGAAWAAFSSTTTNGPNTFSAANDLTAPTIARTTVVKTSGTLTSNRYRAGGTYYVYAQVTDTGNPAAGMQSVTANTSSFDAGVTATPLTAGTFTNIAGQSYNYRSASLTADTGSATGVDRAYTVTARDNATNEVTTPAQNARANTYQEVILATAGILSHYPLNETTGTVMTDVAPTTVTNGTYFNAPTLNQTGTTIGDATNRAVTLNGTDEYATAARQISGNFSIEFWFRSNQAFGTGTQWYQGAGLVDGDASGTVNDFGVSLNQGKVMAGTGNADTTITTTSNFNNNVWHHVVFTRTTAGALRLYVDGALAAPNGTGSTAARNTPASVAIGRIQTGNNYYAGSLDEVAFYSAALSAAQVTDHYRAGLGTGF